MARFILLVLIAGTISATMFVLMSLFAFYAGWYLFGLAGHPAAPDAPPAAYLAYAIAASLLCLWTGFRVVFRRPARQR